jgi:hypothetical protein
LLISSVILDKTNRKNPSKLTDAASRTIAASRNGRASSC